MKRLLVLDAGNTDITVGVFDDAVLVARHRVPHRGVTDWATALMKLLPNDAQWCGSVVASVAPSVDEQLRQICLQVTGKPPLEIDHRADLGMTVATDAPERVGADRLVNAAGAYLLYGGPLVVADAGTAITLCVVSADGCYLGGAIAPGLGTARDALAAQAEKLPLVPLEAPASAIGSNTESAMQAGLMFGFAGLLDRLLQETLAAVEGVPKVYLTGGMGPLLSPHLRVPHASVPDLTLIALRLMFDRAVQDRQR